MNIKSPTHKILLKKYPKSLPCDCIICKSFCSRPGWWTVEEARRVIEAGYKMRMMLEMSPDLTIGVLSPAFKGCEGNFALQEYANNECTFLINELCELHGTKYQPLECCYSHHSRKGLGKICHNDLEMDWRTVTGQRLVEQWGILVGLWERYRI